MVSNAKLQMQLYRARLQIEEGQSDVVLHELQQLQQEIQAASEKQQQEFAYLLGWCYVERRQWDEAMRVLSPLLEQATRAEGSEIVLERERIAFFLLCLGKAASNLFLFVDASLHFQACLKLLHDRRIHLPRVRIQGRYSLATAFYMRGLYQAAIREYMEALRLCQHYQNRDEVPNIHYGLTETYRAMGDYERAGEHGEIALKLYREQANRTLEARMLNGLGYIRFLQKDYSTAADLYTEALSICTGLSGQQALSMMICANLATLRLAEGRPDAAWRYCERALGIIEQIKGASPYMEGVTYRIIGEVVHAEAMQQSGERRKQLLARAVGYFERAIECLKGTQTDFALAEVYRHLAQTLEAQGQQERALEYWRSGYELLHASEAGGQGDTAFRE
ncbi:tetratricopeptide repeat protein [Thermosporothrix hazakensis]|uniref:Tetratricopeptide repeat protein n=1 Tax=Thermosporothrix hazakensis TaxID=644383 RepID=A0A326UWA0_THEHA|nr:tetratricopeptide repeat protein [Thermosporothrix hazakensis]PZW36643.1 tetratricopeptide repeat protein [Thermosporothrix hazakensis]